MPERLERAGLLVVALHADRERLEQIVERASRGSDVPAARRRRQEEAAALRRRIGERRAIGRSPPARSDRRHRRDARSRNASQSERHVVFSMRSRRVRSRSTTADHQPSRNRGASSTQPAVLEDEAAAVVDQPVLPADGVGVEQHRLVVGGARRQHLAPRRVDAHAVRRGRDVDDDLGARIAAPAHRPVRRPRVLADLDGDGRRSRTRRGSRRAARRRRRAPARGRRARTCAPRRRRCRSAASPSARGRGSCRDARPRRR